MHFARVEYLLFTHHGDVVFRLAGNDAGITSDAGGQIDRHPPRIAFVLESLRENRQALRRKLALLLREVGIRFELIEGSRDGPAGVAFHRKMMLHGRELELLAQLAHARALHEVGASMPDAADTRSKPAPLPARPDRVRP